MVGTTVSHYKILEKLGEARLTDSFTAIGLVGQA